MPEELSGAQPTPAKAGTSCRHTFSRSILQSRNSAPFQGTQESPACPECHGHRAPLNSKRGRSWHAQPSTHKAGSKAAEVERGGPAAKRIRGAAASQQHQGSAAAAQPRRQPKDVQGSFRTPRRSVLASVPNPRLRMVTFQASRRSLGGGGAVRPRPVLPKRSSAPATAAPNGVPKPQIRVQSATRPAGSATVVKRLSAKGKGHGMLSAALLSHELPETCKVIRSGSLAPAPHRTTSAAPQESTLTVSEAVLRTEKWVEASSDAQQELESPTESPGSDGDRVQRTAATVEGCDGGEGQASAAQQGSRESSLTAAGMPVIEPALAGKERASGSEGTAAPLCSGGSASVHSTCGSPLGGATAWSPRRLHRVASLSPTATPATPAKGKCLAAPQPAETVVAAVPQSPITAILTEAQMPAGQTTEPLAQLQPGCRPESEAAPPSQAVARPVATPRVSRLARRRLQPAAEQVKEQSSYHRTPGKCAQASVASAVCCADGPVDLTASSPRAPGTRIQMQSRLLVTVPQQQHASWTAPVALGKAVRLPGDSLSEPGVLLPVARLLLCQPEQWKPAPLKPAWVTADPTTEDGRDRTGTVVDTAAYRQLYGFDAGATARRVPVVDAPPVASKRTGYRSRARGGAPGVCADGRGLMLDGGSAAVEDCRFDWKRCEMCKASRPDVGHHGAKHLCGYDPLPPSLFFPIMTFLPRRWRSGLVRHNLRPRSELTLQCECRDCNTMRHTARQAGYDKKELSVARAAGLVQPWFTVPQMKAAIDAALGGTKARFGGSAVNVRAARMARRAA